MSLTSSVVGAAQGGVLRGLYALPPVVRRRLAGRPVVIDGKRLDPEMQLMLRSMKLSGPPVESLPMSKARAAIEANSRAAGGRPSIGAVTDRSIPGPNGDLTLRFYTPRGLSGPSPALVYLHGGGFVYGSIDSHDSLCRTLAEQAQVRVISVDYRLAPEHPFPSAPDECWAAWTWITENAVGLGIDPDHIAIGGDSAGANLATVVAQEAVRRKAAVPAFQLLIYPVVDFTRDFRSEELFGEGFFLTNEFMRVARENYLTGHEDVADPRVSPLQGTAKGQPPAAIVTAGFDPLLDQGGLYAEFLRDGGVAVDHWCEEGLIHGYANLTAVGSSAPKAIARLSAALQRGLS